MHLGVCKGKLSWVIHGCGSMNMLSTLMSPKDHSWVLILFLIFINDLRDDLTCRVGTFADHTTLCSSLPKPSCIFDKIELAADLESDLRIVVEMGEG